MSRRVVAPVLLLLAAACSLAAVFAVHRIEAAGGPLAEPWATPYFSPDGDGTSDRAAIRFTTQRPERITVTVVDSRGRTVATLARDERIDGKHELEWDGTTASGRRAPQGEYHVRITRSGDARTYSPTRPTELDTTDPIGRLDRSTWVDGELHGLALLEPGTRLEVTGADGEPLQDMRAFLPNPSARSARPEGPAIPGTVPVRFTVPLDLSTVPIDEVQVRAVDLAGNSVDLLALPGAPTIRVDD